MSLFSNASKVKILGGTFYSTTEGINIQNNLQLAIQENEPHGLVGIGAPAAHEDGAQTIIETRQFPGPQRTWGRFALGIDRFSPYDISVRRSISARDSDPGEYESLPVTHPNTQGGAIHSPPCPSPRSETLLLDPHESLRRGALDDFPNLSSPDHNSVPKTRQAFQAIEAPSTGTLEKASHLHSSPFDAAPGNLDARTWSHVAGTSITGGTFFGGNVNNIQRNGESGIGILHRAVALAALHDAAESYPQPRCHPETRKELLEKLRRWCTDSSDDPPILWLHGPAGAGKSAVMITVSEQLQDTHQLGGAFFFKRGHSTRGNANVLFATIALQLAVNIPELRLPISRVVEENPTVVARSMAVQLQELIFDPCNTIECSPGRIILIDGLDECEGKDVQQDILCLLGNSLAHAPLPFRFVIASRPEPHIREVLDGPSLRDLCSKFNIEQSYEDVRAYLQSEFARIHREHSTMAAVPTPWPSPDVVDRLVEKSSGYFIYASTIIKYIDDKAHRPTRRLAAIEALSGSSSQSPFTALDSLYTQILSSIPETPNLVSILRVIYNFHLEPSEIEELLGVEAGDVRLALRGLHSLIRDEEDLGLSFIHASFGDFLNDPSRAGDFYTGDAAGLEDLARLVLSELGYTYDDLEKNRTDPIAFSLGSRLGSLLKQVAPSEDLVYLFRAINPDFIIYAGADVDVFLSWLQRVQPPPTDLVQIWEDYQFLNSTKSDDRLETLSDQQSAQLKDQLAECPLLLRIFHTVLLADNEFLGLMPLRYVLYVSWDEFRAAICCLRPIFPDGLAPLLQLSRFIHSSMTHPSTWRANISIGLAVGCIKGRNQIETGDLPECLWYWGAQWGRFIRGSPCSAEVLSGIKEFVLPEVPDGWDRVHQDEECHDVIQWLKRFPEPPLEEIRRWEMLFLDEQEKSYERPGYFPPNDYEERWRKWDELCPE